MHPKKEATTLLPECNSLNSRNTIPYCMYFQEFLEPVLQPVPTIPVRPLCRPIAFHQLEQYYRTLCPTDNRSIQPNPVHPKIFSEDRNNL